MIVATHNEEESVIKANIEEYRSKYGELIPIEMHPRIRSDEACYQSTAKAIELATKYNTSFMP
jgi:dihydroorotase